MRNYIQLDVIPKKKKSLLENVVPTFLEDQAAARK